MQELEIYESNDINSKLRASTDLCFAFLTDNFNLALSIIHELFQEKFVLPALCEYATVLKLTMLR